MASPAPTWGHRRAGRGGAVARGDADVLDAGVRPSPDHRDLGRRRLGAAQRRGKREYPSRIFCTREHGKRECTNRAEVEELFASYGFEVVLPEKLPLPDQVELFHRADVIAGFAGSAMFTTLFSDRPKHLILVSPDTYGPSNEYMISAVRGHRLDLAIGHSTSTVRGRRPAEGALHRRDVRRGRLAQGRAGPAVNRGSGSANN